MNVGVQNVRVQVGIQNVLNVIRDPCFNLRDGVHVVFPPYRQDADQEGEGGHYHLNNSNTVSGNVRNQTIRIGTKIDYYCD